MPEELWWSEYRHGASADSILSTRSISLISNLERSSATGAVLAKPRACPQVLCGHAHWTVSKDGAASELPIWLLPSVRALVDLINHPPGWDSRSAKRIVPQNAMFALELLAGLLDFDTPPPSIVPRIHGNIQLEWHMNRVDIEIYIDSPDRVRFFAEDTVHGRFNEGSLVGREEELRMWLKRLRADRVPI